MRFFRTILLVSLLAAGSCTPRMAANENNVSESQYGIGDTVQVLVQHQKSSYWVTGTVIAKNANGYYLVSYNDGGTRQRWVK